MTTRRQIETPVVAVVYIALKRLRLRAQGYLSQFLMLFMHTFSRLIKPTCSLRWLFTYITLGENI